MVRTFARSANAMKLQAIVLCTSVTAITLCGADPARAADPTTADCLSASENSLTLGSEHQLRAARAQLLVCAAASCPADVRKECTSRVADVNAAMPTIIFEARDAAGNDVSAVRVTMDGQRLAARLEGAPFSIDPGEHAFSFEMDGQPVVQKTFVIHESEKDRREVVVLGAPVAPATAAVTTVPGTLATSSTTTPKRLAGFIVGGVGGVDCPRITALTRPRRWRRSVATVVARRGGGVRFEAGLAA